MASWTISGSVLIPARSSNSSCRAVEVAILVKRVRHEAVAGRAQSNGALALCDHDARQRRLAGLGDGFPQHGVDVLPSLAVGHEEIGGIVVDRVDRRGVDELLDRHHRRAVDLDAVEVVVAQQQVFALPEFVAFDERAALQFLPGLAILRDHADAVAGLGIDEIEPDPGPVVPRVVEGHGAGHEGEAQVTAPDGSRGHQAARSGSPGLRSGIARCFSISLVVLRGVGERGEVIPERVLDVGERILHARRGRGLRHARLVPRQLEQLDEAAFVVARQSERIGNRSSQVPCEE